MNGAPDFLTSLQSVVLLMLMVLPGYLAVRFKVVTPEANPPFSSLLTKVTLPCLLFSAFAGNKYNSSILSKLGICFVVSLFTILVTILIAAVVFARMKDSPTKRVYIIASYFANAGFMGIPVINALFPGQSEPLMFTAVLMLAINIIAFTWIEYSVSGDRKFIRPINALLNPPNIAIVISLPFFFTGFQLPGLLNKSVVMVGSITTPLSMIIIGMRLATVKFRELFNARGIYSVCAVKLILCPLAVFAILKILGSIAGLDHMVGLVIFILNAMPSAALLSVFAEMFRGDTVSSAKCIMLTTVLSVITIPLAMLLAQFLH